MSDVTTPDRNVKELGGKFIITDDKKGRKLMAESINKSSNANDSRYRTCQLRLMYKLMVCSEAKYGICYVSIGNNSCCMGQGARASAYMFELLYECSSRN